MKEDRLDIALALLVQLVHLVLLGAFIHWRTQDLLGQLQRLVGRF
jgi:hypothetical protein